MADAITSVIIEAQSNRHVDLTTADGILAAVSDGLELGLWIAELLPDQVAPIAAEQMTGPGGMDWRTTGTVFADLRQFADRPSPMFRGRLQSGSKGTWRNTCEAIVELQRVYTVFSENASADDAIRRSADAVCQALRLGLIGKVASADFAAELWTARPHRDDDEHVYLRSLFSTALEMWLVAQGKTPPWAQDTTLESRQAPSVGAPGAHDKVDPSEYDALLERPELWRDLATEDLQGLALFAVLRYGQARDQSMVGAISNLYRVVVERLSVPQRRELLVKVNDCVERGLGTVDAFLPLIFQDPETGIISTAALNFASLGPLENEDPLTAPQYMKGIADQTQYPRVRVGILTGLLLLGDRRVLRLLHRCWLRLTPEERQRLAHAYSGFVYAGVVDFFLDWLEDADEESFGLVAAALANMPATATAPNVLDIERVFPATSADSGPSVRLVGEWSFEAYGRILEPRFRDLLRRENEPKVLPQVMAAWGLRA